MAHPRKRKTTLNPTNYDLQVPRDLTSLNFSKKLHPTEFDMIWFLIYHAKREFMSLYHKDLKVWKATNKPKHEILILLQQLQYTFNMNELKTFCNNDRVVKSKLKAITSISAKTNTFNINYLPLTVQESDPKNIDLITSINGRTNTYSVCTETMYKILLIPQTNHDIVSLICTADIPSVKSKTMYHLLCSYEHFHIIQGKSIQQWVISINFKANTRWSTDYNTFIDDHLTEMIDDMANYTNFIVQPAVRVTDNNTITITYKGRH